MGEITVMATNNIKPFATGNGANVTSQAEWEMLSTVLTGFQSGKASSAQVNKALRQATFIASALAQYTADKSGLDVLDDGNTAGFIAKMASAFGKDFQPLDATLSAFSGLSGIANKLPYFTGNDAFALTDLTSVGRNIIGQSSIANILSYLGLGDGHGRLINIQVFTSSGTYIKTAGAVKARAIVQGAGGAGGGSAANSGGNISAGDGGDAGSYGETVLIDITGVSTVPVAVGSGGTGSTAGAGTNGGSSSFGSYISAPGGNGGPAGTSQAATSTFANGHAATSACTGTSIAVNIPGAGGYSGGVIANNRSGVRSGSGGDSQMGKGGNAQIAGIAALAGSGYGAGGAASAGAGSYSTLAGAGANGANGLVIIEEYA
ncbi:hypothetical protein ACR9H8_20435 [Kosakonia cowanii]